MYQVLTASTLGTILGGNVDQEGQVGEEGATKRLGGYENTMQKRMEGTHTHKPSTHIYCCQTVAVTLE
ncbi:hypothetical protein E2C01_001196 [Portunus trituberculatus]|uniref:Uncharacterized protein n=1 Tax=Portunus trituberculatus TaxID=210409 RepID=A0A5B7CGK9_PORTR|nr:hypothetical protein [Portunus trituberculatus]